MTTTTENQFTAYYTNLETIVDSEITVRSRQCENDIRELLERITHDDARDKPHFVEPSRPVIFITVTDYLCWNMESMTFNKSLVIELLRMKSQIQQAHKDGLHPYNLVEVVFHMLLGNRFESCYGGSSSECHNINSRSESRARCEAAAFLKRYIPDASGSEDDSCLPRIPLVPDLADKAESCKEASA